MKMLWKTAFICGILTLMIFHLAMAQCPASIVLSMRNNTPASCPSTGSATIGSNSPLGSLQYTIISGPAGAPLNLPQSDSTFASLPSGNYTIKAVCGLNPSNSQTISFTIANGYTAMTNMNVSAVNSCTGGTININSVTGGTTPLQYSVIQSSDANYPDNLSVYSNNKNYTLTGFGTYQVRVKDACNQIYTKTVQLSKSMQPVTIGFNLTNDQPCADNNYSVYFWLVDPVTGNAVPKTAYFNAGGITLNVYEGTAACGKGALLNSFTNLTSQNIILSKPSSLKYYIEVTTPCGDMISKCFDNATGTFTPYFNVAATMSGCGTVPSPATMNIVTTKLYLVNYPVTFTVKSLTTGISNTYTVNSGNFTLNGLTPDNYKVTATDNCGVPVTNITLNNPMNAGAPAANVVVKDLQCLNNHLTNQEGTARVGITFSGYIPGLAGASVMISSGPGNVGIAGVESPVGSGIYYWQNMLPGTYNVNIITSCGSTPLTFQVTNTGMLIQHVKAIASSFCGGNGIVQIDAANTAYNSWSTVSYSLVDDNTGNVVTSNNATGLFNNIAAGTYHVTMDVQDCDNSFYHIPSNSVTVNAAGDAARIVKKLGVICEDGSGNLLNTGTAYLELIGAPPMTLEYKLSTDATWTTYSTSVGSSVTITGLQPNTAYDFRATSCGNSSATQVTIGKLDPMRATNTMNPCENSPYSLEVPQMPGATYVWKNPAGVTVSNVYNYNIPIYNSSYDGAYTCIVTFGSCVTRVVSVTLNSTKCAQPLPIRLTSFTATNKECKAILNWTAVYHNTDKEFIVERSTDGKNYEAINTVAVKQANGQYNYTDAAADLNKGNTYYRLKLIDIDGTFVYSTTQVIKGCVNGLYKESSFTISPNPAVNGQNVTLTYTGSEASVYYTIVNTAGQSVAHSQKFSIGGASGNTSDVSLKGLTPGVYIFVLTADENKVIGHEKLVIY